MTSIGSDITSTIANNISTLRLKSAKANASQSIQTSSLKKEEEYVYNNVQKNQTNVIDDFKFSGRFTKDEINEMKEISLSMGENLTDEDIAYAIKYGRSVIADYSV